MASRPQPEEAIRALLDKVLPREEELKAQQAMQLMQESNYTDALPLLKDAWQLSNQNGEIGLLLAETLIALNRSEDAEAVLKTIPLQDQDTRYQGLVAQIELLKQAADTRNSTVATAGGGESRRCRTGDATGAATASGWAQ